MYPKKKLADDAIYLERVLCKEAGGWQDQIAASFGGFNRINFNANGYEVLPIIVSPDRKKQLETNLMMFFTGFTRFSSDIQKINNVSGTENKKKNLKQMYTLVNDAEKILVDKNNNLDDFGYLLNTTWMLKKKMEVLSVLEKLMIYIIKVFPLVLWVVNFLELVAVDFCFFMCL